MIMLKRGFEGNQAPIILSKEQERLERAGNVYFKIRHYLRIVTVVLCLLAIIFNLGRYFLGYQLGNDNAFTIILGCIISALVFYGIIMFIINVFGTRLLLLYFRIKQFLGK